MHSQTSKRSNPKKRKDISSPTSQAAKVAKLLQESGSGHGMSRTSFHGTTSTSPPRSSLDALRARPDCITECSDIHQMTHASRWDPLVTAADSLSKENSGDPLSQREEFHDSAALSGAPESISTKRSRSQSQILMDMTDLLQNAAWCEYQRMEAEEIEKLNAVKEAKLQAIREAKEKVATIKRNKESKAEKALEIGRLDEELNDILEELAKELND